MSDGRITYEVRVDSSKVASDMAAATAQLSSGAAAAENVLTGASTFIIDTLNNVLNTQTTGTLSFFQRLTGQVQNLAGAASGANAAIGAINDNIKTMSGLNVEKVEGLFSKLQSAKGKSDTASSISSLIDYRKSQMSVNSYRVGSDYIPKDEFAFLHKGEAVLTAAENETLSNMGGINNAAAMLSSRSAPVIVENKPAAQAVQLPEQNVNVTVELDGYRMAKAVASAANDMKRQLGAKVIK